MGLKRITVCHPSLTSLAATLQQIAAMDELPRVANHRRHQGVTTRALNHDFKQLCARYRDGDFATQTDRERMLDLCANQLYQMDCGDLRADDLEPEHVEMLVGRWLAEGLSTGTLKNRMTVLRWLATNIGNPKIVAPTNAAYGIRTRRGNTRA